MPENLDRVRIARAVAGGAVLTGLAATIAGCGGTGSNEPSTTTTITSTKTAPPARTAVPGNRENIG